MGAPTLWQHCRQTIGRAWRESGQALDRVALRLASVAQTKYDFGDEPTRCQDFLSRHRQLSPLLAAGRPVVHPQVAYVAPCATLIGSVAVGEGASIWYGAVLRADTTAHAESFNQTDEELLKATVAPVFIQAGDETATKEEDALMRSEAQKDGEAIPDKFSASSFKVSEGPFKLPDPERTPYSGGGIVIGKDTNIQDGCILSARIGHCLVGQGVTVGHLAQIHSSTVGDFSLIGMGSILQEGSRIGREAFVAAGAVVRPGVEIPSGELWVGNPARKLRDLSDKERAKLHYQSSEYVQVAMGHRGIMELGGNLLLGDDEELLQVGAPGDDMDVETEEEKVTTPAAAR